MKVQALYDVFPIYPLEGVLGRPPRCQAVHQQLDAWCRRKGRRHHDWWRGS